MQNSCGLTTPRLGKSMQTSNQLHVHRYPLKQNTHANILYFYLNKNLTHHFSSSETIAGLKEKMQVSVMLLLERENCKNRRTRLAPSSSPLPFK